MARMGKMLLPDNSQINLLVRLKYLTISKEPKDLYALIMLLYSKMHDSNVKATLAIWADGSVICPWEALTTFLEFRLRQGYGNGSEALWYIENGHAINKQ